MIPTELCLDANVFISATFKKEDASPDSLEVIRVIEENAVPLYEPALVIYEFVSALYQKQIKDGLTSREFDDGIDLFFQLPILFQWQPAILKKANETARMFSLKNMYDCSYLALAQHRDIPLVTLDQEIHQKGKKIFKKIFTPREFLMMTSQ